MDHISKALEKATSERESIRDWVKPPNETAKESTHPSTDLIGELTVVDGELLSRNHVLSGPGHEDAVIADKYRLLRTRIMQLMKPRGWTTLGITSAGPQAGKTLTAMNLAITIARSSDQQVVLIDADLRKPSISEDLGLDTRLGLIDYLTSEVPLPEVLVSLSSIPNLTILPGRREEASKVTPELLNSHKMRNMVEAFTSKDPSTLIIVDLPPVLIGDDVLVQASHLQCVLLVVEEDATNAVELQECAELLSELNLLGTVLNKSQEKARNFEGYYQIGSES